MISPVNNSYSRSPNGYNGFPNRFGNNRMTNSSFSSQGSRNSNLSRGNVTPILNRSNSSSINPNLNRSNSSNVNRGNVNVNRTNSTMSSRSYTYGGMAMASPTLTPTLTPTIAPNGPSLSQIIKEFQSGNLPPNKVVKANCNYSSSNPREIPFKEGDFFYVVQDMGNYYLVCNPLEKTQGIYHVQ